MDIAYKYCRALLPRVSRSFALTIPMLDKDMVKPVLITYLQDRLLDNFEDEIPDSDITLEKRKEMMDKVVEFFAPANDNPAKIAAVLKEYASFMPEKPLQELTSNALQVRRVYDGLSGGIKKVSYKWLQEMNNGMKKYLTFPVKTFTDLNEYCYYVAGTVGGFLTDTILLKRGVTADKTAILKKYYNDAGLFLQKVNLVRDIGKDIRNREKNYWPLKELGLTAGQLLDKEYKSQAMAALEKMLQDIRKHIPALINYYESLPKELEGYRRFYCVNNALGLATMKKLENNPDVFYSYRSVKVPRVVLLSIIKAPEKAFYNRACALQKVEV